MLKIFSSSSRNIEEHNSTPAEVVEHPEDLIVTNCPCCGTLIKFPPSVTKYKCIICRSTQHLACPSKDPTHVPSVRFDEVQTLVHTAHYRLNHGKSSRQAFETVELYIVERFGSIQALNNSFIPKNCNHKDDSTLILPIDYAELHQTLRLIAYHTRSRRPYLKLLSTVSELLRRPLHPLATSSDLRWILLLLELPALPDCLYHNRRKSLAFGATHLDCPEVKTLCYEIISRSIGYLANADQRTLIELSTWICRELSPPQLENKVQLVNLFITFHLTRLINQQHQLNIDSASPSYNASPHYSDYNECPKLNPALTDSVLGDPASGTITSYRIHLPSSVTHGISNLGEWTRSIAMMEPAQENLRLKVSSYGNDWRIRTAARLLSVFYTANKNKIPVCAFYNTLSDYIYVKQDFEMWQSTFKKRSQETEQSKLYYDILNSGCIAIGTTAKPPRFTFCQYPFLLTLGSKIVMLEYEARRTMEHKAEEAFIKSLDSRKSYDLHLKLHVRRTHITNDSLRILKGHKRDLKKALKVEFIGEPGIDVGGLKKEWFQLLVRDLIRQDTGMFFYNEESHLCWFSPSPLEKNQELYNLVGVVLGLAIYNSTILDLKFPLALYKKLMGKKVTFDDYRELFPATSKGLTALLETEDDVDNLCIYYDTTFKDLFGNTVVKELIPNGSNVLVTKKNRRDYVAKWVDFYMNKATEDQFQSFYRGFHDVIGGNSLSLFSPMEIELVICGNKETKIDTESFKAITKYNGWYPVTRDPATFTMVKWFWEWFEQLNYEQHKKFLAFVTGSDRIPATGVSTMTFKLTRLQSYTYSGNGKLPVAHTCFNELCLYDYKTKAELWSKLEMSMYESEGFGLH